jgi:hypothetical protein
LSLQNCVLFLSTNINFMQTFYLCNHVQLCCSNSSSLVLAWRIELPMLGLIEPVVRKPEAIALMVKRHSNTCFGTPLCHWSLFVSVCCWEDLAWKIFLYMPIFIHNILMIRKTRFSRLSGLWTSIYYNEKFQGKVDYGQVYSGLLLLIRISSWQIKTGYLVGGLTMDSSRQIY